MKTPEAWSSCKVGKFLWMPMVFILPKTSYELLSKLQLLKIFKSYDTIMPQLFLIHSMSYYIRTPSGNGQQHVRVALTWPKRHSSLLRLSPIIRLANQDGWPTT